MISSASRSRFWFPSQRCIDGTFIGFFGRCAVVKTGRFDEELAVHTVMLGMVNERLPNVTCEDNVVAGIFYTPHPEIDLMCGLARVDWPSNQIGQQRKKNILI